MPDAGISVAYVAEHTQLLALGANRFVIASEPNDERAGAITDVQESRARRVEELSGQGHEWQSAQPGPQSLDFRLGTADIDDERRLHDGNRAETDCCFRNDAKRSPRAGD